MFKKSVSLVLLCSMLLAVSGCSFFAPFKQNIYIDGTPADATVVVNGVVTKTPATIEVPRNKNLTIIAHKNGFKPWQKKTGYSLNTIGTLDAIGCYLLLLPGLGMLSPGAWELEQDHFYYILTPAGKTK